LHAVKVTGGGCCASPDPEVPASAKRRAFTAEFKRRLLAEADACGPGDLGALLHRHGLYSSHLTTWRRARERGELAGLTPRKRGRKATAKNPLADEVNVSGALGRAYATPSGGTAMLVKHHLGAGDDELLLVECE